MFQSQRMKKVDVIIVKKFADEISKEVVKFGDFQVIEIAGEKAKKHQLIKNSSEELSSKIQEFERRVNYLSSAFESYSLEEGLGKDVFSKETLIMDESEIEKNIKEIETELNSYNIEKEEIQRRQSDLAIKIRKVNLFSGFNLDLGILKDLKYIYAGFGIVPLTSYEGFLSAMSSFPSTIELIDYIGGDVLLIFAAPKKHKEKIDVILKNVYFRDYGLPFDLEKGSKSKMVKYAFDLSSSKDEELWLERNFHKLSVKAIPIIKNLKFYIQYYISIAKLKGEMASTGKVFLFSGWVPAALVEELKISIENITDKKCIFLSESAADAFEKEGLVPPTKFSNPGFLRPFEGLVATFGIPNYKEIDPTPIAAIAYVLMYGAMFGDVGHGFVLALIGLIGMFVKKFKSFKSFATVIFYIGISSIVFGFLYGSVFGHENILKPIWISPAEHIMDILMVAIAFGAITLTLGLILSIINSILEKDYGKLLFSSTGIAGLSFYLSLIYIGYSVLKGLAFSPFIIIVIVLALIAIAFEKRLELLFHHKHGEEEEEKPSLVLGFVDVFETAIAFLSKTISFMRVAAFALNHGALMGAFFILANMSNINIVQWIVILIGNLFVVGFEGGIVGIQALRLEYYEFFVAFFRANGRKFEGLGIYKTS